MSPKSKLFLSILRFAGFFLFFFTISLFIQSYTGGFSADRSNNWDEAGHFVSSLAIDNYILTGALSNPFVFMTEYYHHFPKVAIGHWPPLFEFIQSIIFLVFGGTAIVAIVLQAAMAGFCAGITTSITARSFGIMAGVTAGFVVLFSPIFLPMIDLVMADTLEALVVTLTAICWGLFYKERNWRWCFLFSLMATLSLLTKGTAIGLALMPIIYVGLRRDFAFLLNIKTLVAAAVVAAITAPWYIFTYQMAADGFIYKWGWSYSRLSVPYFFAGLFRSAGIACTLMYCYGTFRCLVNPKQSEIQTQPDVLAFASCSIAMMVFAMLVPAYLDTRYLIPALPSFVIVAFWGFYDALDNLTWPKPYKAAVQYIPIAVFILSALPIFHMQHVQSLHSEQLVNEIMSSHLPNKLILMSGNVEAEGAFVSRFAEIDTKKIHYVIRGQKALADSSWMTDRYEPKFKTAKEVARWINDSGIGWIVLDSDSRFPEFPHNALLKDAIDKGLLQSKLIKAVDHSGGQMSLYELPGAANVTKILDGLASAMLPGHLAAAPWCTLR